MDYQEAVDFIHGIARFGTKPGLRRVQLLLERMGNPQRRLKFIHVAGTNGKGSTCAMLSRVLARAGYKTGLYVSPFVLDFRERIQINNEMIEPEELAASTTLVKTHWDILDSRGDTPSEFETLVAVAFDYYVRKNVDVVVLEVGLGGRLDATNVISAPVCSVITSISLDHTEHLGDTISQIAFEKAGIIKRGGVTVCYPDQNPEALAVIRERCAEEDNPLIIGGTAEVLSMDLSGARLRYDGAEVFVPLAGEHQVHNTVTVLEALRVASERGFPVTERDIADGIAQTSFPARMEVLCRKPTIILDGAHNHSGAQQLGRALELLGERRIHAVMGMLSRKDVSGALAEILPHCASLTAIPIDGNAACMPERQLMELASKHCAQVESCSRAEDGVRAALSRCGSDDVLLVCGSLYLAEIVRPILLRIAQELDG